jgi:hypothetical protein
LLLADAKDALHICFKRVDGVQDSSLLCGTTLQGGRQHLGVSLHLFLEHANAKVYPSEIASVGVHRDGSFCQAQDALLDHGDARRDICSQVATELLSISTHHTKSLRKISRDFRAQTLLQELGARHCFLSLVLSAAAGIQ